MAGLLNKKNGCPPNLPQYAAVSRYILVDGALFLEEIWGVFERKFVSGQGSWARCLGIAWPNHGLSGLCWPTNPFSGVNYIS